MKTKEEIFEIYKEKLTTKVVNYINEELLSVNLPKQSLDIVKNSISDDDVNGFIDLNIEIQKETINEVIKYQKEKGIEVFDKNGELNNNLPDEDHSYYCWSVLSYMGYERDDFFIRDLANKIWDLHFKDNDIVLDTFEKIKEFCENSENISENKSFRRILSYADLLDKTNNKKGKVIIEPVAWIEYVKQQCNNSMITEDTKAKYSTLMQQYASQFEKMKKQGLEAAAENVAKEITILNKKSLAVLHGCDKFINQEVIETFTKLVFQKKIDVNDKATDKCRVAYFKKYEEFPRIIPDDIFEKKKILQDSDIFEEFYILYLDYTNEELQSVNSKLTAKQKDPILFGKLHKDSNDLYFIADWIDEVCDLTFDKLAEKMANEPSFAIEYAGSPKNIDKTIKEAINKHKKDSSDLSNATNRNAGAIIQQRNKLSFFDKILKIFN